MRDRNINNEAYFEKLIESHQKRIQEAFDRIEKSDFAKENIPLVKNRIFFRSLEILIASYSNGESAENLHKQFSGSLNFMTDGWDDTIVKFKMGRPVKVYDYYTVNHYCYMLWMLSFAVLLDVPGDEIAVLENLIAKGNIDDRLLLYLLSNLAKKNYPDTSLQNYEPFKRVYKEGNLDSVDATQIKNYLNDWYSNCNYLTWYESAKSVKLNKYSYFGYWSFESAALVAINGLDDSCFNDHAFYPKDLVDYYRSQKRKEIS